MTMDGFDPAQLRALRDLAQLCKDRDLAALSQARGVVSGIEAQLVALDAAVEGAKSASAKADPVSLAALDRYLPLARERRERFNTDLARARAKAADVQQKAVRATGQVEILDQMQALRSEAARLMKARRSPG